jgi:hypothetical protein
MNPLATKFFLFFLTLSAIAGAGGTVPATYGNGIYLPKSDGLITWSAYGGALTPELYDVLVVATASLDAETLGFRLAQDSHPELSMQHVFFSFVGGDPYPECLDDVPGGCTLGLHHCLLWDVEGPYRLCKQNRVRLFMANIAATKDDVPAWLHDIVRHEWVHVLGYEDGVGGPANGGHNKFTPCQVAQLSAYVNEPTIQGWTTVILPECQ